MGGLGPGIGGIELIVIAIVALVVVGPKDLPMMMRKVGKVVGKARAMANEFRSSFDEMARQSELDDLRKEVEALRTGQGVHRLGPEADAAFREIRDDLNRDVSKPAAASAAPALTAPEADPALTPTEPAPTPEKSTLAAAAPAASARTKVKAPAKTKPVATGPSAKSAAKKSPKTAAKPAASAKAAPRKPAS